MVEAGRRLPGALSEVCKQTQESLISLETGIGHIREVIRAQRNGVEIESRSTSFSVEELIGDLMILATPIIGMGGIEVVKRLQPDMGEVRLPRNQLLQALLNLLKNSAEAIAERFEREQGEPQAGKIEIECSRDAECFRVEIRDNGNGVDPAIEDNLMRFGFTTKQDGSGFGLHAAGNFVAALQGKIELNSSGVGKGTTVEMRLPL